LTFLPPIGKIGIIDHKIEEFDKLKQLDTILIECNVDKMNKNDDFIKVNVLKHILKNIDYDLKNRRLNFND
jgi:hypothetical protein